MEPVKDCGGSSGLKPKPAMNSDTTELSAAASPRVAKARKVLKPIMTVMGKGLRWRGFFLSHDGQRGDLLAKR